MSASPGAQVCWLPQQDTSVIVLGAAPSVLSTGADKPPPIDEVFSTAGKDDACILFDLGNGERTQIMRHASGSGAVAAMIPLGLDGFDRLESVHRLLAALHGRVVPPDTRLTRQQRKRARRMLQAFDGYREGATQKEIAQVLFHVGSLGRDEWQTSSFRHSVSSLLRDARAMVAGGYRKLLRHRHRP